MKEGGTIYARPYFKGLGLKFLEMAQNIFVSGLEKILYSYHVILSDAPIRPLKPWNGIVVLWLRAQYRSQVPWIGEADPLSLTKIPGMTLT